MAGTGRPAWGSSDERPADSRQRPCFRQGHARLAGQIQGMPVMSGCLRRVAGGLTERVLELSEHPQGRDEVFDGCWVLSRPDALVAVIR